MPLRVSRDFHIHTGRQTEPHVYTFTYDGLNRLTDAVHGAAAIRKK